MKIIKLMTFVAFLLPSTLLSVRLVTATELKLLTNPQPFFSMLDGQNGLDGYSIDLNKAILDHAGYDADVESLPWARVLKRSEDHTLSVISAIVRTPERENLFFWVSPISVNPIAVYTIGVPTIKINSLVDVSKLGNIAVLRDDYRHQILGDEFAPQARAFNRWSFAVESLLKGRTKSLFFSDMGLTLTCIDAELDCSSIRRVFVYDKAISYLALRKKPELQGVYQALKKSAKEFKESPDFQELISRYLNSDHPAAKFLEVSNGIVYIKAS